MVSPGTFLREARKSAGLSMPKLAALAGTSAQQIERLEKGERELTRVWAERLAPHLSVAAPTLVFPELSEKHSNPNSFIDVSLVLACLSSLLKRYLRTLGLSEPKAEAAAPVAAQTLLKAMTNPPEPAQGFDRVQQIRFEVDRLARQLLTKEH